jgi:hypothetical protein
MVFSILSEVTFSHKNLMFLIINVIFIFHRRRTILHLKQKYKKKVMRCCQRKKKLLLRAVIHCEGEVVHEIIVISSMPRR